MARKRRNHFIPRMLLKRFASRSSPDGAKQFIWRFERGNPALELSTKDAGVAKDFYGEHDDVLENSFIEYEGAHSAVLREIDGGTFSFETRSEVLADIAWLLAIRTEANRTMMLESVATAAREMVTQLPSEAAQDFFKRNLELRLAEKALELSPLEQFLLATPAGQAFVEAKKSEFLETLGTDLLGTMLNGLVSNGMPDLMRNSHNEGLDTLLRAGAKCPPARSPTRWSVIPNNLHSYVLGDACVFCATNNGGLAPLVGGEDLAHVYLPINPSLALVGHFNDRPAIFRPEQIVSASIAMSSRYVFAHEKNEHTQTNVDTTIGSEAFMLKPGDANALITQLWDEDLRR